MTRRIRKLRVAADAVILAATALFLVLAVVAMVAYINNSAYSNAPKCSRAVQVLNQRCYVQEPATVVRSWVTTDGKLGPSQAHLTIHSTAMTPQQFTIDIPEPPQVFYQLHRGDTITLKIWDDLPTGLYGPHGQAMRSQFNPLSLAQLDEWGGLALLGCAAVLLTAHPPRFLLSQRLAKTGSRLPKSWEGPMGKPDHVFRYGPLRFALTVLLLLNLLDILTSIIGGRDGLFEQNPIASAMVQSWGPLGGFFGLKLPAVLVVVLAASKLPRKLAVVVTYAGCAVMLFVVVDNLGQEVRIQEQPAAAITVVATPTPADHLRSATG